MLALSVSIVVFKPDLEALAGTLSSLSSAIAQLSAVSCSVSLIDNTPNPEQNSALAKFAAVHRLNLISGQGNVGFGAGHNLCLPANSDYHLILNPDVILPPDGLEQAIAFLETHPEFGLLAPQAIWPDGSPQPLCKRYPSVLDLLLRGFAPEWLKMRFGRRLAHYELRDAEADADGAVPNPPLVSGCCMLFRSQVLNVVGGFDPRYFMYFEDFDLSIRTAALSKTVMLTTLTIVHAGGRTSRKGAWHLRHFIRSAVLFFNKHGWRFF